jgi:hypothetical protein
LLGNVFFHIQSPFVQGLTVGPTANPLFFVCNNTRLMKKLFPVLYFPTMLTAPIFFYSGMDLIKSSASGLKKKPYSFE